jgi:GH43 family beta-xylosidase
MAFKKIPTIRQICPNVVWRRKDRLEGLSAIIHIPQIRGNHVRSCIEESAVAAWVNLSL